MMNRNIRKTAKQVSETHRANIQKRLEHRLAVAKAKGNEELVRLLEAEMQQL
ncbi:MAG: arginine synthesis PII-interacting regulator PirA [Microcoleaceae cyanobacterium]